MPGRHQVLSSCDVCQRTVKRGSVRKVPLGSMPLIDTPFKRVAVDIVGPIAPPSEAGHRYILTLVDYATRYPEAVPLKKITTEAVAEALLDIYSRVGIPEEVLTDQGTQFMSECMQEVSRLLSIKGLTSTPYHPICNGLVERWNGTLKSMLKRLCQDHPKQWHRLINPVLFAYREVPQESTGFSPFQLLYGRSVRGPGTILKELWTKEVNIPEVKSSYEYVTELRERLEDSLKLAQEELEKSQKRYKRHYDRKAKPRRLEVGDRVLILLPTDSNKLLMQWRGPYTVESRVGANDYRVKMGSKTKTYHVNMLKKYISREPEGNVVTVDSTDGATIAVAGVIHQDVDPELGEVPDLEGYRQREGVRDVKLGDELPEDQRRVLKDLVRRYPDVFTDMPGETDVIQHQIRLYSTPDYQEASEIFLGSRRLLQGSHTSLRRDFSTIDRPPKERKSQTYPVERGTGACILPSEGIPVAGASPEASRFEQAVCVTNRRIRSWCGGCATSGK